MNKTKFTALLSLAAMLTACQSQEAPEITTPNDDRQIIDITISEVQAQSRAGRELTSTESGQSIDNVKILVVDPENKVVWTKLLDQWMGEDAEAADNGRKATLEIPKDEYRMLAGEEYHIYALGYSTGSDFDVTYYSGCRVGDSFRANETIRLTSNTAKAEEIFAGDCVVTGNPDGVRAELVLNRQVAGTFGYMTKIPYVKDRKGNVGSYLILTASDAQDELCLGNFDNVAYSDEAKGQSVVNGVHDSTSDVIYTIDLHDWFTRLNEEIDRTGHSTGLIVVQDNWRGDKRKYRQGSVFAGAFIIPFSKNEKSSMQLHLCYDKDVTTAIRTWNVLLPDDAHQLSAYDVWTYGANGWTAEQVTDDARVYNVLRNHLYGIGRKDATWLPGYDPENPDAPIDPDDPTDQPEPINNKQEISVLVNHSWGMIYNMGVE